MRAGQAQQELAAAEKRVSDAKGVVEHVEAEIRETMDKEHAARMRIDEAVRDARSSKDQDEERTKFEREAAELAKSPQIQRLALETNYSHEYLASLQMTMKLRTNMGVTKKQQGMSKSSANFLAYLEEASMFRENLPLKERVAYLFNMFDEEASSTCVHTARHMCTCSHHLPLKRNRMLKSRVMYVIHNWLARTRMASWVARTSSMC